MDIFEDLRDLATRLGREPFISLFGFGVSSRALYSELVRCGFTRITVRSDAPSVGALAHDASQGVASDIPRGVPCYFGVDARRDIFEDAVLFSPSVRREGEELESARRRGCLFSSDCELFFSRERGRVFAISGSDGKSTTAYIASALLSTRYGRVVPSGNFGAPFCSLAESEVFCAELSSFNLEYITPPCYRGVITNITENHLDWHGDMESYLAAKSKLLRGARECAVNLDCPYYSELVGSAPIAVAFSARLPLSEMQGAGAPVNYSLGGGYILRNGEPLLSCEGFLQRGRHFTKNLLCALALTDGHYDAGTLGDTVARLGTLPHRCEKIVSQSGRIFYDSSIDTTPSRTVATLGSLGERVGLILGGRGKGLSPEPLIPAINEHCSAVALYGDVAEELFEALYGRIGGIPLIKAQRLLDAVDGIISLCEDAILLSPAATSYGEFAGYGERGEKFTDYVKKI